MNNRDTGKCVFLTYLCVRPSAQVPAAALPTLHNSVPLQGSHPQQSQTRSWHPDDIRTLESHIGVTHDMTHQFCAAQIDEMDQCWWGH